MGNPLVSMLFCTFGSLELRTSWNGHCIDRRKKRLAEECRKLIFEQAWIPYQLRFHG